MSQWNFEQEGLKISASKVGAQGLVVWKGVSDTRSPGTFINPLAKQLVEGLKGTEVTVDFTQLEYMNSATVGPLVNLIKALDANGQPVLVLFSEADWQKTHLNCMRAIARTLKYVRVEGRPAPSSS